MTPFQYLSAALGVLLGASALLNAWQYHQHDQSVRLEAQARQYADDTKVSASACSASVVLLAKDGRDRQAELVKILRGIAPAVAANQKAAIEALNAKPDNPQDLCASLGRYLQGEITRERTP